MEYKGYRIELEGQFSNRVIKPTGKRGSVPKDLRGMFTSELTAQKAIDRYVLNKG